MNEIQDAEVTGQRNGAMVPMQPPTAPIQKIETRYATAIQVQKPRSLPDVSRRLCEEAALSGDAFFYGWGAGQDKIEGPTVKLANAAVRCYGNCAIDMAPVQETHDAWIFTAIFIDLETGFTMPRQFRQSKTWTVHGRHDAARKEDIRFQIGQSKAIRNLVLNALPSGLIDRAMETAKNNARAKLTAHIERIDKEKGAGKGLVTSVDWVIKCLAKVGVKEETILSKLDIASRTAIDVDRLLILHADLGAIEGGEVRAEELYPPAKPEEMADKMADRMGKKEDEPAKEEKKSPKTTGKNNQQRIEGVDEDEDLSAAAR